MSNDVHCAACEENERRKAAAGPGPWTSEPNRHEFRHAGLPCIVHRGGMAAWCGYVGVSAGHPWYRKGYDDDAVDVRVHGGLTYAKACQGHVCHVPVPGEDEELWWFGFDCGHAGDLLLWPQHIDIDREVLALLGDHYWTMAEVIEETKRLAEQLAAAA